MTLETLKGITSIGGFEVNSKFDLRDGSFDDTKYIHIDDNQNCILYQIQNGPIKEVGVNGCQVDTVIHTAKTILEGLNKNFPCRENAVAITKLDEALMWMEKRTKDREKRGVEGTNQA